MEALRLKELIWSLVKFDMYTNITLPETNIAPENGWLEY